MKLLGLLLTACVVLSVLQVALSVLVVVGLITLLYGVFHHPGETFGLLAFLVIADLLRTHTVACLAFVALVAVLSVLGRLVAHRG